MRLKNPLERLNLVLWQPLAGYGSSILALLVLLTYRLNNLVPGFSTLEVAAINHAKGLSEIFHNPLFAPHEVLQYLGLKLGHFGFIAMRLPTVMFALLAALLFFFIASRWFNFRVAVISTMLFVTSSWFLHIGRIATPEILLLGLLAPLAYSVWLPTYKRPMAALLLGALVLVTLLYIPGFVWFVFIGLFWQRKSLLKVWRDARVPSLLVLCGCIIAITPLIVTLVDSPSLAKAYFGLPLDTFEALKKLPKNLLIIPYNLVIIGPDNPANNLGRLPLLDFFAAVMAIIGAYSYATHSKLHRSRLLLACLILGSLLAALKGSVTISIVLPFVYLLVAGGINFMIEQWFMVFPYNPFARNLAIVLIFVAIGATGFFHFNRYYIAWPQAPATKNTYHIQPVKP